MIYLKTDEEIELMRESNLLVGMTLGEIWGYHVGGLFRSDEEATAYQAAIDDKAVNKGVYSCVAPYNKLMAGDVYFLDLNDDKVIDTGANTVNDPGDRTIIGNELPRYIYSLRGNLTWKGFDFAVFFQGVGKRDLYLPNSFRWQYGSQWQVPTAYANDYWTESNRDAYFPVARFNGGTALGQNQTRYLLDGSYLRLKSLSFGYTLPETLTQKAYIQKARIYFTAENLFTIKHTPEGFDPELDNPYAYPQQRALSIGVNLTF